MQILFKIDNSGEKSLSLVLDDADKKEIAESLDFGDRLRSVCDVLMVENEVPKCVFTPAKNPTATQKEMDELKHRIMAIPCEDDTPSVNRGDFEVYTVDDAIVISINNNSNKTFKIFGDVLHIDDVEQLIDFINATKEQ